MWKTMLPALFTFSSTSPLHVGLIPGKAGLEAGSQSPSIVVGFDLALPLGSWHLVRDRLLLAWAVSSCFYLNQWS